VLALQGSMQQRARLKALERFRATPHCVLLASDVAARGIDVRGVDYVVHYQLPRSAELYVHRSGRTARAAASGTCIALIDPTDHKGYRRLSFELQQPEGFPDLPLSPKLLPRALEAVSLARQIDKAAHLAKRSRENDNWRRQLIEDMDLPEDSDSDGDADSRQESRRLDAREQQKVEQQKKELGRLLQRFGRPGKGAQPHTALSASW